MSVFNHFIQKCRLYHFEAGSDDDGVEERLRDVRVEVRHGAGEGGDVVRQAVVRVLQPAVQVGHPVEGLGWNFELEIHKDVPLYYYYFGFGDIQQVLA